MKPTPSLFALLIVAAATFSACSSSERTSHHTPQWIDTNPNLQFDFTVPIYNDPVFLGIKVNVAFDGMARFYLLRSDQPYTRIKAARLTSEERTYLASLFEEAHVETYPEVVPVSGQVNTPPSALHLGYRAEQDRPYESVHGAVSKKRDEGVYPDGFFDLLDGLSRFVSDQLNASASAGRAGPLSAPDRRVATKQP